jgi:hypothetical protein
MLRLSQDGGLVIEGAARVDQVFRVEDPAAIIALVASRVGVVTVGAFAFDEAVWKESFVVKAVELGYLLAVYVAVLLDFEVEVSDELFVDWAFSSRIVVEIYLESLEKLDDEFVVLVGELARRNTEFDRLYLDRSAMLIASADHDDVFALQSEIACINIGGQKLGEGSKVGTIVDVRPSSANNPSPQFFHPFQNRICVLPFGL